MTKVIIVFSKNFHGCKKFPAIYEPQLLATELLVKKRTFISIPPLPNPGNHKMIWGVHMTQQTKTIQLESFFT